MTVYIKWQDLITQYTPNEGYGFLYDYLDIYDNPARQYDGGNVVIYTGISDATTAYNKVESTITGYSKVDEVSTGYTKIVDI